jgi:NADH-quinone oxidoreductase subunit H
MMFDFSIVTGWIHAWLTSLMPLGVAVFVECVAVGIAILVMYAVIAVIMIYMERKVCAAFQCRLGPNRVGPFGIFQLFADIIKMLIKEIIVIRQADRFLYNLAPYIVILASVLAFSCLPVSRGLEVLDFNVGVLFFLAASSIGVVGILLAGWGSNNKYSLIGAMRSGAQMVSYELSVGISILTIIVLTDTMQLSQIVERQADGWFIFKGHVPAVIAFLIYLIAGNAEVNRGPFDLPEAESELTAGYHTEYSGMHFGLFYVAEFVNLFIISAISTTIFLGGWMPLHIASWTGFNRVMDFIPGFVWFFGKSFFVVWLLMWIKWTFPRLRIDQILTLEWKILVPIGLLNLLLMTVCVVFGWHF